MEFKQVRLDFIWCRCFDARGPLVRGPLALSYAHRHTLKDEGNAREAPDLVVIALIGKTC